MGWGLFLYYAYRYSMLCFYFIAGRLFFFVRLVAWLLAGIFRFYYDLYYRSILLLCWLNGLFLGCE